MALVQYFKTGCGIIQMQGEMGDEEKLINSIGKFFSDRLDALSLERKVPISLIPLRSANRVHIVSDPACYHFFFVDVPGPDTISFQRNNRSSRAESFLPSVRQHLGEIIYIIEVEKDLPLSSLKAKLEASAEKYFEESIKRVSEPAKGHPVLPSEIASSVAAFSKDHPKPQKTAFIVMSFHKTAAHDAIVSTVKTTLAKHNILGLRADDKEYNDELFANVRTYMHAADFGIGVFERIMQDDFNPNVSLEVGYIMALGKDMLLLKDQTLKNLPTDLVGRLYKPFDPQRIAETLPAHIEKWLKDKGHI